MSDDRYSQWAAAVAKHAPDMRPGTHRTLGGTRLEGTIKGVTAVVIITDDVPAKRLPHFARLIRKAIGET